jgi:DNA damage-binding protein 1
MTMSYSLSSCDSVDLGCLVNIQATESSISLETCTLMGGVSGYIGLALQLPPTHYQLLFALEQVLAEHVTSVGKIEHNIWRLFQSELGSKPPSGFVDGDLIETYLDLPKSIQSELIKNLRVRVVHSMFSLIYLSLGLGRQ